MRNKIYILLFAFALIGCSKQQRTDLIAKDFQPANVDIIRFDSALLAVRTNEVKTDVNNLFVNYPDIMPFWANTVLFNYLGFLEDAGFITMAKDSTFIYQLPAFLHDRHTGLEQPNYDSKNIFSDITPIKTSLNNAYGRWLTFEPDHNIPRIYFILSAFFYPLVSVNKDMAVGVEAYLGSDYAFYDKVVYNYQKQTMRPECIPVNIILQDLKQTYPNQSKTDRLLDDMIYQGKIMYTTAALFPELPKYEIMGYTKEKWQWCEQYEADIWKKMLDQQVLFSIDPAVQSTYLSDGPFTSEISQDSPARLGSWIGWRIVENYMNNNTQIALKDMLCNNDAQAILEQSKYRP